MTDERRDGAAANGAADEAARASARGIDNSPPRTHGSLRTDGDTPSRPGDGESERRLRTDGGENERRLRTDGGERGSRDVVVPMPLYKTVTVFSTLLAVLGVVGGFVLLDAAVMSGGVIRVAVNAILGVFDLQISPSIWGTLQPVFAVLGLGAILLGAVVYVLGSRFRAEGMGGDGDDADETDGEATDPRARGEEGSSDASAEDGGDVSGERGSDVSGERGSDVSAERGSDASPERPE
jgi:hypothetical protein